MNLRQFACVLAAFAGAASAACGNECNDSYKCGTCDPSDPQICNVGGTTHVCEANGEGLGGGVSLIKKTPTSFVIVTNARLVMHQRGKAKLIENPIAWKQSFDPRQCFYYKGFSGIGGNPYTQVSRTYRHWFGWKLTT